MSTLPACATGMYLAAAVDGVPADPCAHRVPTLPAPPTTPPREGSSQGPGSVCSVSGIFISRGLPRPAGVRRERS